MASTLLVVLLSAFFALPSKAGTATKLVSVSCSTISDDVIQLVPQPLPFDHPATFGSVLNYVCGLPDNLPSMTSTVTTSNPLTTYDFTPSTSKTTTALGITTTTSMSPSNALPITFTSAATSHSPTTTDLAPPTTPTTLPPTTTTTTTLPPTTTVTTTISPTTTLPPTTTVTTTVSPTTTAAVPSTTQSTTPLVPPAGWSCIGQKCFKYYSSAPTKTWDNAVGYCLSRPTVLLAGQARQPILFLPENDDEKDLVLSMTGYSQYWLNLNCNDKDVEGTWVCVKDEQGTTTSYTNFSPNDPYEGSTSDCGFLRGKTGSGWDIGKWYEYYCNYATKVVCQISIV